MVAAAQYTPNSASLPLLAGGFFGASENKTPFASYVQRIASLLKQGKPDDALNKIIKFAEKHPVLPDYQEESISNLTLKALDLLSLEELKRWRHWLANAGCKPIEIIPKPS